MAPPEPRSVQVRLLTARNLMAVNYTLQGLSDPFCELFNRRTQERHLTDKLLNTTSPLWHQSFTFSDVQLGDVLDVYCWDSNITTRDVPLGNFSVPFDDALKPAWAEFRHRSEGDGKVGGAAEDGSGASKEPLGEGNGLPPYPSVAASGDDIEKGETGMGSADTKAPAGAGNGLPPQPTLKSPSVALDKDRKADWEVGEELGGEGEGDARASEEDESLEEGATCGEVVTKSETVAVAAACGADSFPIEPFPDPPRMERAQTEPVSAVRTPVDVDEAVHSPMASAPSLSYSELALPHPPAVPSAGLTDAEWIPVSVAPFKTGPDQRKREIVSGKLGALRNVMSEAVGGDVADANGGAFHVAADATMPYSAMRTTFDSGKLLETQAVLARIKRSYALSTQGSIYMAVMDDRFPDMNEALHRNPYKKFLTFKYSEKVAAPITNPLRSLKKNALVRAASASRHVKELIMPLHHVGKQFPTWKIDMRYVCHIFGSKRQGWNQDYEAARKIFESKSVRGVVIAQHAILYGGTGAAGVTNVRHSLQAECGALCGGMEFVELLQHGERTGKTRMFTYVLKEKRLYIAETGADFFLDMNSKHAVRHLCVVFTKDSYITTFAERCRDIISFFCHNPTELRFNA